QMAGGAGYLTRRYVNGRTGGEMSIYLVCGRSGPVSVHTPDVCYRGAGFEVLGDPTPRTVEVDGLAEPAEVNRIEARADALKGPVRQEVLWSWSARGKWETPRSPRLAFARYPVLYKLYVIHPLTSEKGSAEEDPSAAEFIRILLPEVQKCLF